MQHDGAKVGNFLTLAVDHTLVIALFLFTDTRTKFLILISFSNFSQFLFKKNQFFFNKYAEIFIVGKSTFKYTDSLINVIEISTFPGRN